MKTKNSLKILDVKVDNLDKSEILEKIRFFLSESKFHQIATINPEFILEAKKNQDFKDILNNCDLNVADGFGIRLAFWRFGKRLRCRLAGADLMMEILKIAGDLNLSIFLANKKDGLSSWEETRVAILKTYPNLKIYGANLENKPFSCSLITDPCILFCNFGAPHQELFINSQKCANIRLAMGVGGSFDFLTGKIQRAPHFMRKIGLEWLWRLIQQPKRMRRIFNAVVIFPIKIIFNN
jgi:N-acetylglucosaminyldiphosphoundecaprenol N-acetyl-beta-D-mannosaminyltransferase